MTTNEQQEVSQNVEPIDSKTIFQLFFYSFEHSQGSPTAQNLILLYITRKIPGFILSEEHLKVLDNLAPFERFVKNENVHKVLVDGDVDQRIAGQHRAEMYTMFLITHSEPPSHIDYPAVSINYANAMKQTTDLELIPKLLDSLLDRDIKYLQEGRAKKEKDGKSYLREHSLFSVPTGFSIYDQIYGELRPELTNAIMTKNGSVWDKLQKLAVIWEAKHPGRSFFMGGQ